MQGVVIPCYPTACVFGERAGDAKALWGLGEADVLGAEYMLGVGWISMTPASIAWRACAVLLEGALVLHAGNLCAERYAAEV